MNAPAPLAAMTAIPPERLPPLAAGAFYCVLDLLSEKSARLRRLATAN